MGLPGTFVLIHMPSSLKKIKIGAKLYGLFVQIKIGLFPN